MMQAVSYIGPSVADSQLVALLKDAQARGVYVQLTVFDEETTAQVKRAEEQAAIRTLLGPT